MSYYRYFFVFVFLGFVFSCSDPSTTDSNNIPDGGSGDVSKDEGSISDMRVRDTRTDRFENVDTGAPDISNDTRTDLPETALQKYIREPESVYKYELISKTETNGFQEYIFRVTSLTYLTLAEVDRPVWTHDVFLIIPPTMKTDIAVLLIDGGSNHDEPPTDFSYKVKLLRGIATQTGTALASVSQVPNQPLTFSGATAPLGPVIEDDLVAYTWRRMVEEKTPRWAAYFPMAKAVTQSMNTLQDYVKKHVDDVDLNRFIITGFSKRGAATYMVAAADERVIGLAPGVFDVLGFNEQFKHHYAAYGFWGNAVKSYVNEDMMKFIDAPDMEYLEKYVDPLSYVDYLTEPKFLVIAGSDQFFLPDSSQFYFKKLKGPKTMRVYANAGHKMKARRMEIVEDIQTFVQTVVDGNSFPSLDWEKLGESLHMSATEKPSGAAVWTVTNPDARDFRIETIGETWVRTPLEYREDGKYEVPLTAPSKGFTAYIVDLEFADQIYSTPTFISPDVLPFKDVVVRDILEK